ncbi:MAG: DegT/DnrJ/EryC1/StrS family aminotransferase, partial [Pseudomonadota bacterium]
TLIRDQRDQLKTHLDAHGIPTGIHYSKPLPFYDAYSRFGHTREDFPVSVNDAERILSLPLHAHITAEDQLRVVSAIQDYFSGD